MPRAQPLAPGFGQGAALLAGSQVKRIAVMGTDEVRQALCGLQLRVCFGQLRRNVGCGDGNFCPWIGDVMLELFGAVHRVHRYHYRISAEDGKVRNHPLRRVLHVEHHAVALFDAHTGQRGRQPLSLVHDFGVGEYAVKKYQCGFVRKAQGIDGQVVPQRCCRGMDFVWQPFGPELEVGAIHKVS